MEGFQLGCWGSGMAGDHTYVPFLTGASKVLTVHYSAHLSRLPRYLCKVVCRYLRKNSSIPKT